MAIRFIPEAIIRQIAAGEVIERPASVVKELVENSLDAGATEILISCLGGGITSITVSDNGCGIPPEELPIAVLPFTTSKLDFAEPWKNLHTFGFRGEALASILSCAEVTLQSQTPGSPHGYAMTFLPGKGGSPLLPVAHPPGTTVIVKNLFGHLPARRKFLRTPRSEAQRIRDLLNHYLLLVPPVGFKFESEGKTLLDAPPSTLEARLSEHFHISEWLNRSGEKERIRFRAYLTPPQRTFPSSRGIYTFVNGRIVRDQLLRSLIQKLYLRRIPEGHFPFAVLFLELPTEEVDVNVHPAKLEVRYRRSEEIFSYLFKELDDLLKAPTSYYVSLTGLPQREGRIGSQYDQGIPELKSSPGDRREARDTYGFSEPQKPIPSLPCAAAQKDQAPVSLKFTAELLPELFPLTILPEGMPIGILGERYLLYLAPEELIIVDQHAAHERIRYEEILASLDSPHPPQPLLIPSPWRPELCDPEQIQLLVAALEPLGFNIEPWGPEFYIIRTVPFWLDTDPVPLLNELVPTSEELFSGKEGVSFRDLSLLSRIVLKRCALIACHTAIRSGDTLTYEEQRELLEKLRRTPNASTCPHGRPTYRIITLRHLNGWFLR